MQNSRPNPEIDEHAELTDLLRSLRTEPTPEAHFEERFIADFHDRLAERIVYKPICSLLWDHVVLYFSNMSKWRLFWGLSTCYTGLVVMGLLIWQYCQPPTHAPLADVAAMTQQSAFISIDPFYPSAAPASDLHLQLGPIITVDKPGQPGGAWDPNQSSYRATDMWNNSRASFDTRETCPVLPPQFIR